ncbi:MAG: STY0301 family protein [Candidatus Solibacter sp.]|jgi:hypothetical protein
MRFFATLLVLAWPIALAAQAPAPLTCPATLAAHEFERINIYNGKPGGEEYDLAPDDQKEAGRKVTQMWFLKDYRTMPIFVRCRYHGTTAVTTLDVPAKYQKCTLTFEMDSKNAIVGKSEFSCK